jgi:CubicO group peptidase (beta-lactamase class C family)
MQNHSKFCFLPAGVFYKSTFYFLIVALFLSCQSVTQQDVTNADTSKDTIASIILPEPALLNRAEADRLYKACKLWYDSTLMPKGFSGGILIAKNGNIVFEQYGGTAHIPGTDNITANTPMHIASVSKTFTAMAVLKLWEAGKLNIDDELSKYISGFNYPGVTIRSLLNHRSGLPNYTHFLENMGWKPEAVINNEQLLDFLINNKARLENIMPPNTHFAYCNTNYALLALLIEKVSGKKYADYLSQNFFIPLGMKNSFVFTRIADSAKVTPSYDWKGRNINFNYLDAVYGDKNVYTTVKDLFIWDRAIASGKLFTAATMAQAHTPYSNEKPGIKNYGLGWRMNIYPDGKKMLFHNGWWHGSNASFVRLTKEDATLIAIGNKFNRSIYGVKILSNLFGDYYTAEEEEENENTKTSDSTSVLKNKNISLDSLAPAKKSKTNKVQEFFKDNNKVNTNKTTVPEKQQ